ncbi:MAG: hypothetical protein ACH0QD_02925 [Tepidibacillus sp.]
MIESIIIYLFQLNENRYIWISLLIITLIGTYDDLFGDTKVKGLRGHIKAFFHGKITSGFLKAAIGGLIALFLAIYIGDSNLVKVTNFLLILFMINTINLFDLRPGRALKVFFILFFLLSISSTFLSKNQLGLVVFTILTIVFFQDVHAKIMLGDSGANLIGLHLGIWYSMYFSMSGKWIMILFLIGLHIYTERYSLSRLIENNKILKRIDLWGRRGTV